MGHYISYCYHRIVKQWYCYDDDKVYICNDYKKGVPYLLFYESTQGNYNILFENNLSNNENNYQNQNFNMMSQNMNNLSNINLNNMNYFNNNINNLIKTRK